MSRRIRVALAGVGNTASAFLQGLVYYGVEENRQGLWHPKVGGYKVGDIDVVAAFDVSSGKVGLDLGEASFAGSNVFPRRVPFQAYGVRVSPGVLVEPLAETIRDSVKVVSADVGDVEAELVRCKADVLLSLISSGLDASTMGYAEAALKAGCSFVNVSPSPLVSDSGLVDRFKASRLVVAGDDLMTQFGGTAFHRGLLRFMDERGVRIVRSYQLDVGGGEETLNTLDENVRAAKRKVKTASISVELPYTVETVAGTTDYVDFLGDRRTSYFWVEGEGYLGEDVKMDIYLKTSDGANAGNILLDVVRAVQASRERGTYGAPDDVCGYGFKNPPSPRSISDSLKLFSERYLTREP